MEFEINNLENEMTRATLKTTGITIYIYEDKKPNMHYNHGMLVVSKQPNSMMTFCVKKEEIEV